MFQDAEDTEELVCRIVQGPIEIGVWPVLFGYRVRAGFEGRMSYEVDWCAGQSYICLNGLYWTLRDILASRQHAPNPFAGIPGTSLVKPVFLDLQFQSQLQKLLKGVPRLPQKQLPELDAIRRRWNACNEVVVVDNSTPARVPADGAERQ